MDFLKMYEKWLTSPVIDNKTKKELLEIKDNETEIKDRFISMLSFGTAGLRGVMGAGMNRMNIYVVRYTTQALAQLIKKHGGDSVVVGWDARHNSDIYSYEVTRVLAANGIKSYVFDELRPTPEISFAIRDLNATAGINITASHNTKIYNGYKAYWSLGIQLDPEQAQEVANTLDNIDIFDDVNVADESTTMKYTTVLDKNYDEKYIQQVLNQIVNKDIIAQNKDLSIIYTPIHGAGYRLVPEVLRRAGFENIGLVEQQQVPDGDFPTVKAPNPENEECFVIPIEKAKQTDSSLIIGTDADADRMGIAVRTGDDIYRTLTGNQTGAILLEYILSSKKRMDTLPENACVIKTIVTSELATRICEAYGVKIMNVLTGFKFIGEKAEEFKTSGEYTYILGFEESYGYLIGDYARDKDSVSASLLIAEAAAYYKSRGLNLYEALQEIYIKYGYHKETTVNIFMEGIDGAEKIKKLMENIRKADISKIGDLKIKCIKDYSCGIERLPPSNVMYYTLEDNSVLVIRPSGTEPKVKIYILVNGKNEKSADEKVENIKKSFMERFSL